MAVKLRMKMFGRRNRPEFRIVAADSRSPRDGTIIETLGYYHPLERNADKVLLMKEDRIKHWLSVGAQPSETLVSIFKRKGITIPWTERAKEKLKKDVAARREKKGKKPKGERKAKAPKPPKPAAAETEDKAKAAESKAAKREAKKAQ